MPHSISFVLNMVLVNNSQPHVFGVVERKNHTLVEMARMIFMSIRLLDVFGLKQSTLHVIFEIKFSYTRS
jgi:hypothetical protein